MMDGVERLHPVATNQMDHNIYQPVAVRQVDDDISEPNDDPHTPSDGGRPSATARIDSAICWRRLG